MKVSAKPISSPGRTEKFPPPLMRFLKSNVGSRSRGRTRASPMFMRKSNKNNITLETTQEPSSPKVTCIGQVRVRRSSKSAATRRSSSTRKKQQKKQKRPCCCNFRWKLNRPKSLISVFKKWVCCFRFGCCEKRVETVDSSSRVESTQRVQSRVSTSSTTTTTAESTIENAAAKIETENEEGFLGSDSNSNPPKNALLLTRCRSAPYRSSSLAGRFWGSPLNSLDNSESQIPQNNVPELEEKPVLQNPISPGSRKSEEMQSSINGGEEEVEEEEGKNGGGGAYVHPLLLTRCKSEPARTGERLNPRRSTEPDTQS